MNTQQPTRLIRSWRRFSIRTLLVMTTLVAIFFARWNSQRRLEQEIEEIVRKHGGHISSDFGADGLEGVREWCASHHLAKGNLHVWIIASKMTTSEREGLCDRLGRRGSVHQIRVRDADDEILQKIGTKLNGMTELLIEGRSVTDEGLAHLDGLESLERLSLDRTTITGRGFSRLHDMSRLNYLEISSSRMTDAGVAELIEFSKLRHVTLAGNEHVTNASVRHFGQMKSLRYINIWGTRITDEGMSQLRKSQPALQEITRKLELGVVGWVDRANGFMFE